MSRCHRYNIYLKLKNGFNILVHYYFKFVTARCGGEGGQRQQLRGHGREQGPPPGQPVTDVWSIYQNVPWRLSCDEPSVRGDQSAAYPSPEEEKTS